MTTHFEMEDGRQPLLEKRSPCGITEGREAWGSFRGPDWTSDASKVTCPACRTYVRVLNDPEWLTLVAE